VTYPTREEWDAAADRADRAVVSALGPLGLAETGPGGNRELLPAISMAAAVAVGRFARAVSGPANALAERLMVAHLRGALRGLEYPVHEDGREFTETDVGGGDAQS
jgi:hypothetical protein